MDGKKFITKVYQYVEGELQVLIHECETIEEAFEHGFKAACHCFKILDQDGVVHHNSHHGCGDDDYA